MSMTYFPRWSEAWLPLLGVYHLFWFPLRSRGFRQGHKAGHSGLFLHTLLGPAVLLSSILLSSLCLWPHSRPWGARVIWIPLFFSCKVTRSAGHLERLLCFEKWMVLSFQEGTAASHGVGWLREPGIKDLGEGEVLVTVTLFRTCYLHLSPGVGRNKERIQHSPCLSVLFRKQLNPRNTLIKKILQKSEEIHL